MKIPELLDLLQQVSTAVDDATLTAFRSEMNNQDLSDSTLVVDIDRALESLWAIRNELDVGYTISMQTPSEED